MRLAKVIAEADVARAVTGVRQISMLGVGCEVSPKKRPNNDTLWRAPKNGWVSRNMADQTDAARIACQRARSAEIHGGRRLFTAEIVEGVV